jgi:hypothetical protein
MRSLQPTGYLDLNVASILIWGKMARALRH